MRLVTDEDAAAADAIAKSAKRGEELGKRVGQWLVAAWLFETVVLEGLGVVCLARYLRAARRVG